MVAKSRWHGNCAQPRVTGSNRPAGTLKVQEVFVRGGGIGCGTIILIILILWLLGVF
jgi:hypothetical protein